MWIGVYVFLDFQVELTDLSPFTSCNPVIEDIILGVKFHRFFKQICTKKSVPSYHFRVRDHISLQFVSKRNRINMGGRGLMPISFGNRQNRKKGSSLHNHGPGD